MIKIISEYLGTFFLVFIGTGAIIISYLSDSLNHFEVSLIFGLIITLLIYIFAKKSGAHFNPAVSISFFIRKDIDLKELFFYIVAQILGALTASVILLFMFGNVANLGATIPSGSLLQSFLLEFFLTFLLMIVILGIGVYGKASKNFTSIIVGTTVFLGALWGGPISGASMNPARSIGPAIISNTINHLWIYIVATILGAIIATLISKVIYENSKKIK